MSSAILTTAVRAATPGTVSTVAVVAIPASMLDYALPFLSLQQMLTDAINGLEIRLHKQYLYFFCLDYPV